ncbi:MAG: heliorhodopsin HeR [Candidatus Kerfeldbacteria bacterium]|nr:heliorhodopsin HeR [Candidatus Kerfeldbacteria bacterium]
MSEQLVEQTNEQRFHNLRVWNVSMGGLHLAQGIIMLLVSSAFALPITTAYVEYDLAAQKLGTALTTLTDIRVGPLVAGFLFLSALAHLVVSVGGGYRWYVNNLKRGLNLARWVEYSFSSSLMIVVIAMLVGIYDLSALILLFTLNAMMILCGWLMEIHNQTTPRTDWTAFIFGCIAGLVPWVVIGLHLFNAGEGEFRAPMFVYWIYGSIFVFFNIFAINMILQYRKVGRWHEYLYGEKAYILLSLVAKSLLAWQVWAGTLRPV